jgi:hypothetical protein
LRQASTKFSTKIGTKCKNHCLLGRVPGRMVARWLGLRSGCVKLGVWQNKHHDALSQINVKHITHAKSPGETGQ